MLLPVIGLVQVGGQGMADRYTYLPLVGIFVVVVWGLADMPVARPALVAAACVAIAAYALVAHRQLQVWRDSTALWTHALEVTTDNYRAHNAVGALLVEGGRVDEAVPHLVEAVRIEPAFAEAHNNLGAALARRGQLAEAMSHYREALRLSPRSRPGAQQPGPGARPHRGRRRRGRGRFARPFGWRRIDRTSATTSPCCSGR